MNSHIPGRTIVAGMLLLTCVARGAELDAAAIQEQIDQVTAELNEYAARTPDSEEAHALRKAARDAWQAYCGAKNENSKVQQVQSKIEKALEQLRGLQSDQDAVADADIDLAALKQSCADAIAAVRAASKDDRAEAVLAARKARDTYVEARKQKTDVISIQVQIDEVKAEIEALNIEKQAAADGEADLVTLKAAWQTAMAAAKAYLPDRKTMTELARRRNELLAQLAAIGGVE